MIGFLSNIGVEVSFFQWMSMGVFYTLAMTVFMAFVLPLVFKPETSDLSDAVSTLKTDLEKHGKMTGKQYLVAGIMLLLKMHVVNVMVVLPIQMIVFREDIA